MLSWKEDDYVFKVVEKFKNAQNNLLFSNIYTVSSFKMKKQGNFSFARTRKCFRQAATVMQV